MTWSRSASAMLVIALLVPPGCRDDDPATRAQIQALTGADRGAFVEPGRRGDLSWAATRAFYAARGFQPAWIQNRRPLPTFDGLVTAIGQAGSHGLDPVDYGADDLAAVLREAATRWFGPRVDADRVAVADVQATYAYLRYGADLALGRIAPNEVDRRWKRSRPAVDLGDTLRQALASGTVGESLADLAPAHAQYLGLQQALADQHLQLAGASGREASIGRSRARQIELNLDRWRWLPRDLGDRHLLVNVPAYELQVFEQDRAVLSMRVVVGSPASPTPVFSDRMTHVVFSPYWNIPESIMREETVPRLADNPDYLADAGIEVVRVSSGRPEVVDPADVDWSTDLKTQGLRLRQVPGPENALGLVKFIFPNHFNVYLHDTPTTAHFARSRRALSHGCVRLAEPVRLAEYVLADQHGWTTDTITAAMHANEERVARLRTPLPVHLGYWTVWLKPDGALHFTDDPYQVDRQHARAAARRPVATGLSTRR